MTGNLLACSSFEFSLFKCAVIPIPLSVRCSPDPLSTPLRHSACVESVGVAVGGDTCLMFAAL